MSVSRREQIVRSRKLGLTHTEIGRSSGSAQGRVKQTARKKHTRGKPDDLLTPAEAAKLLNVHINTVRRWSNKGILKTYRLGSRDDRRFKRVDIEKLLRKIQPADTT
jgi:excisionase family DNA binding protein